jgi:hypothetical protein
MTNFETPKQNKYHKKPKSGYVTYSNEGYLLCLELQPSILNFIFSIISAKTKINIS